MLYKQKNKIILIRFSQILFWLFLIGGTNPRLEPSSFLEATCFSRTYDILYASPDQQDLISFDFCPLETEEEEEEDSKDKDRSSTIDSVFSTHAQLLYYSFSTKNQKHPFRNSPLYELNCALIC